MRKMRGDVMCVATLGNLISRSRSCSCSFLCLGCYSHSSCTMLLPGAPRANVGKNEKKKQVGTEEITGFHEASPATYRALGLHVVSPQASCCLQAEPCCVWLIAVSQWRIDNWSQKQATLYSECFTIGSYQWCVVLRSMHACAHG